jgi:hypothetical protein
MSQEKTGHPWLLFPLLLALALLLAGCGLEETAPGADTAAHAQIAYRVYSETFYDDFGTALFEYKITQPEVTIPGQESAADAINSYYERQFEESYAITEGLENARIDQESAKEGGYEFYAHVYECIPEVYYNGNNRLSLLNTHYVNSGGAHPYVYYSSETFDLLTGEKLALTDFFGAGDEAVLEKVYQTALAQIEAKVGSDDFIYYEDYAVTLRDYYDAENFFLSGNYLVFYYQPYTIAPYAAGLPMFTLDLAEVGLPALDPAVLSANELERELYRQAGMLIERNRVCFCEIFGLSMLEVDFSEDLVLEGTLYPVIDPRFPSYADLDAFVYSTYIGQEAAALLASGRYWDIKGWLYADLSKDTGMGYYVDWNNYRYAISEITAAAATLQINTTADSPAGHEEVAITVKMLKEDGLWLLEEMFY